MKQTVVEWLLDELNSVKSSSTYMNGEIKFLEKELESLFEQATKKIKSYNKLRERFKECYFIASTNTSSATICKNCGQEKLLHKL